MEGVGSQHLPVHLITLTHLPLSRHYVDVLEMSMGMLKILRRTSLGTSTYIKTIVAQVRPQYS